MDNFNSQKVTFPEALNQFLSFSPIPRSILPKKMTVLKLINLFVSSSLFSHHNSNLVNNINYKQSYHCATPECGCISIITRVLVSLYTSRVSAPDCLLLPFLRHSTSLCACAYETLYLFCTRAGPSARH